MGSTNSSDINSYKLVGYKPIGEPKESLKKLQLRAIKLGINPGMKSGHLKKLDLEPEVKKAMKESGIRFTFNRDGAIYFRTPKSRQMLKQQIKNMRKT